MFDLLQTSLEKPPILFDVRDASPVEVNLTFRGVAHMAKATPQQLQQLQAAVDAAKRSGNTAQITAADKALAAAKAQQ